MNPKAKIAIPAIVALILLSLVFVAPVQYLNISTRYLTLQLVRQANFPDTCTLILYYFPVLPLLRFQVF